MEWNKLSEINKQLKTTDVKGKEYVEVNKRVMAFRELEPDGSIYTEIESCENGVVIIKATVRDSDGCLLATGYAYEKESSSFINKTSYIENCETSAVGRALGFCGIGVDASIASAEEVANAIENQEMLQPATATQKKQVMEMCKNNNIDINDILKEVGMAEGDKMTKAQYGQAMLIIKKIKEGK